MPEPRNHMNRYYVPPGHMPPPGAIDMYVVTPSAPHASLFELRVARAGGGCVSRPNRRCTRCASLIRTKTTRKTCPSIGSSRPPTKVRPSAGPRANPSFPRPLVAATARSARLPPPTRVEPRAEATPRVTDDIPKMREMLEAGLIKDINEQPYGTVTTRWSALHFAARAGGVCPNRSLVGLGRSVLRRPPPAPSRPPPKIGTTDRRRP